MRTRACLYLVNTQTKLGNGQAATTMLKHLNQHQNDPKIKKNKKGDKRIGLSPNILKGGKLPFQFHIRN